MPFNLGGPELIIVMVIVFVIFGAGKLPEVFGAMGKGVKEFKKAQSDDETTAAKETKA
ncbi:MAG: twin-arginine translocase TatA/TatE family subunit [Chloroflexota bacterium]